MKAIAVAAALACAAFAAGAGAGSLVDLNAPGALRQLRQDNPADYAKVRRILAEVQDQPSDDVPLWLATRFDAKEIDYRDFLLTSYPPQKRLSFSLGDTHYFGTITLTRDRARAIPAAR